MLLKKKFLVAWLDEAYAELSEISYLPPRRSPPIHFDCRRLTFLTDYSHSAGHDEGPARKTPRRLESSWSKRLHYCYDTGHSRVWPTSVLYSSNATPPQPPPINSTPLEKKINKKKHPHKLFFLKKKNKRKIIRPPTSPPPPSIPS